MRSRTRGLQEGTKILFMKRKCVVLILSLISLFLLAHPAHTCVGRLIIVAIGKSTDQAIVGHMLATLIHERTGTTVNLVQAGDVKSCHETVIGGEANIYVNYIGVAWVGTGGSGRVDDPQKVYTLVSRDYLEKYGMVWLKPFGFEGPLTSGERAKKDHASLAVPITTRDVLKRFPVLDRVINKLAGRIDNDTIEKLRNKAEKQEMAKVVREFLKAEKLI